MRAYRTLSAVRTIARSVRTRLRPFSAVLIATIAAVPAGAQSHAPMRIFSGGLVPDFTYLRSVAAMHLLLPVSGVEPRQLRDTYREARSGGRVHDAIDIPAPRGTPVLAVTDGTILRLHQGSLGGNSIYQLAPDGRTRFYYAHLDSYAEGLHPGQEVKRGDVIGYVGDTGNAAPGDTHLHFSIAILQDVHRWWEGHNLNPYPILHGDYASPEVVEEQQASVK
jgi:murein DD-endopeptidase MepM/ murein hydrolase activator NlpD